MKKTDIPNGREWEKIVEEAFSSDENHVFSEHYKMQKNQMQRRMVMKQKTNRNKRFTAVIAAAAAMAAVIPTSIYAYNKISSRIEKTGNYQNTVKIQTPESVAENVSESAADSVQNDTEAGFMYYEFGWVPEGYAPSTEKPGYDNEENGGGISAQFYKLPENETIDINLKFSDECENYQSGEKTAMINYIQSDALFNDNRYTREVLITFDGTSYLLDFTLTDDITHEELLKIIDNISLVPTEEKQYGDYIPFLDENNTSSSSSEQKTYAYAENMRNVGDTVSYPFTDSNDGYDVNLNSYEITDSFDGIHTDACGEEADYSEITDENGNIIENIRTCLKWGDGVDTANEIVSEEKLPMHILKMNVTYTNTRDTVNDICVSPIMFIIEDGEPSVYWEAGDEYSYYDSILGRERQSSMVSFEADSEQKGDKNYLELEPGESADVQIVFFVAEDVRDKVNVAFHTGGNDFGEYFNVSG